MSELNNCCGTTCDKDVLRAEIEALRAEIEALRAERDLYRQAILDITFNSGNEICSLFADDTDLSNIPGVANAHELK